MQTWKNTNKWCCQIDYTNQLEIIRTTVICTNQTIRFVYNKFTEFHRKKIFTELCVEKYPLIPLNKKRKTHNYELTIYKKTIGIF